VAASYRAEDQLLQRIESINAERRYLRMRLSALGIYTTDAHANFIYLPSRGGRGRSWHEVFADGGLHVRCYADGGARITVGNRGSTLAVLAAMGKATLGS
jgi:histidinol-phosphate aminotransferase